MASASDFKKLGSIKGVIGYLLVREDGHVLIHNTKNPDEFSTAIIVSVKESRHLEDFIDSGQFNHLCLERHDGNDLLIFSLGKYFLGVIKADDVNASSLVNSIVAYIKTLAKM